MNIYTAQYRYSGADRLDITVKGSVYPGNVLAPTWQMVQAIKAGKMTEWDYSVKYFANIVNRMYQPGRAGELDRSAIDNIANRQQTTLVCFCPSGQFCHRILAARMLEGMGFGKYIGERQI